MKVEVEIPEGKFCARCMLHVYPVRINKFKSISWCNYLDAEAPMNAEYIWLKHPNCPSLREIDGN